MFTINNTRQTRHVSCRKLYECSTGSTHFIERLKLERRLEVHNGCVNTVCWNESGTLLLSGSDDQHLVVCNPFTGKVLSRVRSGRRSNIFCARFLPGSLDREVVSCTGAGEIFYIDLDRYDSQGENRFDCHFGTTYKIVVVPNEASTFMSCGDDGTVRFFDLRVKTSCNKTNCEEDIIINLQNSVSSMAVDPVIPYQLAVGSVDGVVRIYDRRMLKARETGGNPKSLVCVFQSPMSRTEKRHFRITSLNYRPNSHDVLVNYSSENIYLFNTYDLETHQNYSTEPIAESSSKKLPVLDDGSESAGGGVENSNFVEDYLGLSPEEARGPSSLYRPIRRLRLRGDWSDTGPNARPENEGQAPTSLIMQRMSDLLTRMLNTHVNEPSASPQRSPNRLASADDTDTLANNSPSGAALLNQSSAPTSTTFASLANLRSRAHSESISSEGLVSPEWSSHESSVVEQLNVEVEEPIQKDEKKSETSLCSTHDNEYVTLLSGVDRTESGSERGASAMVEDESREYLTALETGSCQNDQGTACLNSNVPSQSERETEYLSSVETGKGAMVSMEYKDIENDSSEITEFLSDREELCEKCVNVFEEKSKVDRVKERMEELDFGNQTNDGDEIPFSADEEGRCDNEDEDDEPLCNKATTASGGGKTTVFTSDAEVVDIDDDSKNGNKDDLVKGELKKTEKVSNSSMLDIASENVSHVPSADNPDLKASEGGTAMDKSFSSDQSAIRQRYLPLADIRQSKEHSSSSSLSSSSSPSLCDFKSARSGSASNDTVAVASDNLTSLEGCNSQPTLFNLSNLPSSTSGFSSDGETFYAPSGKQSKDTLPVVGEGKRVMANVSLIVASRQQFVSENVEEQTQSQQQLQERNEISTKQNPPSFKTIDSTSASTNSQAIDRISVDVINEEFSKESEKIITKTHIENTAEFGKEMLGNVGENNEIKERSVDKSGNMSNENLGLVPNKDDDLVRQESKSCTGKGKGAGKSSKIPVVESGSQDGDKRAPYNDGNMKYAPSGKDNVRRSALVDEGMDKSSQGAASDVATAKPNLATDEGIIGEDNSDDDEREDDDLDNVRVADGWKNEDSVKSSRAMVHPAERNRPVGCGCEAEATPSTSGTQRTGEFSGMLSSQSDRHRRAGYSLPPTGNFQLLSDDENEDDYDDEDARMGARRGIRGHSKSQAAIKIQDFFRKRRQAKEIARLLDMPQPRIHMKYSGHRNCRTMIKESNFYGDSYVMAGSDCGRIFIWERLTGRLAMYLEADKHVVNCVQPNPYFPVIASSGIDYDIKLWSPLEEESHFDPDVAHMIMQRNELMLVETRDTITVPPALMLRVLASLSNIRAGRIASSATTAQSQPGDEQQPPANED